MYTKPKENRLSNPKARLLMETKPLDPDYEKKLRRRVEDRLRKDRDALFLVARVLNIR